MKLTFSEVNNSFSVKSMNKVNYRSRNRYEEFLYASQIISLRMLREWEFPKPPKEEV
jgi:hypothetical protein